MHRPLALLALAAAVKASPVAMPQGVTAIITPPGQAMPPQCTGSINGVFGINAVVISGKGKRQVQQIADGQIQAHTTLAHITQIGDGQVQAPIATTLVHVTQIGDGQVQAPHRRRQIKQIADGQLQAHTTIAHITQIGDGQIQAPIPTIPHLTQIADGQIQAPIPTIPHVTQIGDGQVQAPIPTIPHVTQIADGQAQAPQPTQPATIAHVTQISDGQVQAPHAKRQFPGAPTSCKGEGSLLVTLQNGILKDSKGGQGYIADNFQFQFDNPPQAGALITAGFSVCGDRLALGSSTVFYQCLSGTFNNLYDRSWAAQCEPIYLEVLNMRNC